MWLEDEFATWNTWLQGQGFVVNNNLSLLFLLPPL